MLHHFKIHKNLEDLPENWDAVVAKNNLFLSISFLRVLRDSKPKNMECYAVSFYADHQLFGGALFQYLDFQQHGTFQQNTSWCNIRNYITKKFSKDVLIIGNNMLTGQNGFYFNLEKSTTVNAVALLENAIQQFQKDIKKTSLIILKDFQKSGISNFNSEYFNSYFQFTVQPNMVLKLNAIWNSYDTYLASFLKKYRDRAKTARRKFAGLEHRELNEKDIIEWQETIHQLYLNVAEHAPFNTFFLEKNHFLTLKTELKDNFKIFGYFKDNKLVAFYTFICNKEDIDTYFLGYDEVLQKQNQLYLNMLLDMTVFGVEHQFKKIIFGRTALEIKSTIGAEPVQIFGLIKHNNFFINKLMSKIFPKLEPKVEWLQRKPFK